ncbi:hypothetical protein ABLB69_02255 [Xenorhabdus khoisanae]|uniref:hypothetical protein n=1 Tax=Xenorhabdus khoisanae TaxID=880157 RepID=UPI0032B77B9B
MYTGIVQGKENVLSLNKNNGFSTLIVSNHNHFFDDVTVGASVAIDGTCLTVTQFSGDRVSFDISDFTADTTTLKFFPLVMRSILNAHIRCIKKMAGTVFMVMLRAWQKWWSLLQQVKLTG